MFDVRRMVNEHPTSKIGHREQTVLVLVGPTGSGKTPISLLIAEALDAEILSADSRQIYKLMDIGTAKVAEDQRSRIRHYFVDELLPDEEFSAAEFGRRGRAIVDDILRRDKVPIIVGGSGLYVQALVDGMFDGPAADSSIREKLEARVSQEGGEGLLEELRVFDPDAAAGMIPAHTRRIIRAHEVYALTGIPISRLQKTVVEPTFTPLFVGLQWNRAQLYSRIDARVERMLERGLIDEVRQLIANGYSLRNNALNTVGYREVFAYIDGVISHQRLIEIVQQNSRRYAKRQLTWFRSDKRIRWFELSSEEDYPRIARQICNYYSDFSA